jgi:YVTN family beta-propeller protein
MQADPAMGIASPSDGALRRSLGVPLVVSVCLLLGLFAATIHNADSVASVSGDARSISAVALACPDDAYEADNTRDQARPLPLVGAPQSHTFGNSLDADWVWVDTPSASKTYNVQTVDLTGGADTYLTLYDRDGKYVTSNDDVDPARCIATVAGDPEYCRSSITWVAANTGPYYLRVLTVRFPEDSCPAYRISATIAGVYLPIVAAPPPTPTPSPTPTASSTPSPTPTDTPEPTATPTATADPSLLYPNGLAVDPLTHQVYVTSRDNNRLFVLDGTTLGVLGNVSVGGLPWGIAVNPATSRVYVANWRSQDVYVLDATTRALLDVIPLGDFPTFVRVDAQTNRIFVAKYGSSGLAVINGNSNAVVASVGSGGVGAWGLAFNSNLNRIYIGNRDSGTVTTLDGNNGYQIIDGQTIKPCGGTGSSPYSMDFNPNNNKLYIACSPFHNVDSAAVYSASAGGLTRLALIGIGDGGESGGGGVVVDTATGNAFFTNSLANTVSVVGGVVDRVIATMPTGSNPYGAAADPGTKQVFIGNRGSHNVTVLSDTYTP